MSMSMSGRFAVLLGLLGAMLAGLSGCTYRARGHAEYSAPPPPPPPAIQVEANASSGSPEGDWVQLDAGLRGQITVPNVPLIFSPPSNP